MTTLSPKEIVEELDRNIIGQTDAKRAVAIALRNRWRRQQTTSPMREEILPKNILMIGPTGVGKTEIARRLARLAQAPFIKVEATKFTEVGYVGRDVEQIIRDLLEISITMTKDRLKDQGGEKAHEAAEARILKILVGDNASSETLDKFKSKLSNGDLEDKEIDVDLLETGTSSFPTMDIPGVPGGQMGMFNLSDVLGKALGSGKTKTRRLAIKEARPLLIAEENEKLVDQDELIKEAIRTTEDSSIVFIDEIDKICGSTSRSGADVSREGVQRDLLPLIEGTTVNTKHGSVKTDHILFITSGAFHISKPSDLLPELQGRLPIRVELKALTKEDFVRILIEPEFSLLKQYQALLKTENISVSFTPDAIEELAQLASLVNEQVENIGARRLHTLLEKLLEVISFDAYHQTELVITIDKKMVTEKLESFAQNTDLSKFIL